MAAERDDNLKPAGGKRLLWLSTETYEAIRRLLGGGDFAPDPTQFEVTQRGGKKHFRYRPGKQPEGHGGGGGGSASGAFCSTRTAGDDIYVVGGVVRYGNIHSATISDYLITGTTDFNLYIECNVVVKRTDDEDYFLSGIVSTTDADSRTMGDQATGYPAGTDPDISDGVGVIILEVGRVTFDDADVPTFAPTGCGTFHITHCGGVLDYLPR